MTAEYTHTNTFRGATFSDVDLAGATFRDCDLSGVRISSSLVTDLRISGFDGEAGTVAVDDVDVTAFVAAELDRRHPERVQLRAVRTADDVRAMWETLERLWLKTIARAERLPESARAERVEGEWSFVETLRHLVFATDSWVGRVILDDPKAYHACGLPPSDYGAANATEVGIDLDAQPTYGEVVMLYADRRAQIREVVCGVTDTELERVSTAPLSASSGPESHSVGDSLRVLLREHCEHRRFAERDLTVLEG